MSSDSSFLDNGARPGANFWQRCLECLREECTTKQFDTWLRPVQEVVAGDGEVTLLAPNDFVLEYLQEHFWDRIETIFKDLGYGAAISLKVGSKAALEAAKNEGEVSNDYAALVEKKTTSASGVRSTSVRRNFLNSTFTFENFIEGKSNQLAKAAALQTAVSPGKAYNPLFIYGGVGLGKTHLMHAVGNEILRQQKGARVLYLHSERFVSDMIKSLQHNSINEFKNFYRSLDALLIDDIQFFAGKERSQEELFHTFNSLLDESHQIILTCDRYPKEIEGLDERLKSRFGWGLAVAIEPPELETRVAILISKAKSYHANLSEDVAFFIAKHVQSNVRELEGALKKIIATASFLGSEITIDIVQDSLKDLLTAQARQITIANIQKTVAAYYKIRITDLTSKNRSRNVARPRQMAMTITKELTDHSLPEIADAFGGRDHTTVIHAQRTIKKLITTNAALNEDYKNLIRVLSS